MFCSEKVANLKCKIIDYFRITVFIYGSTKRLLAKSVEDEQTLAELKSAHRRSQAKCQLVQTSYIKQPLKSILFASCNKHLMTDLSRSLWENLGTDLTAFGLCLRPRSRFCQTGLRLG